MSSSSSDSEKFDPARRRLCPDGACVGLLDDSGRCKECGRTASGKVEAVSAPAFDAEPEEADLEPAEAGVVELEGDGGFDSKRKLCPDGSCVGVLGADGRCKVCGQAG